MDCSSHNGLPDRMLVYPDGKIVWVELKRPKIGRLSDIQKARIDDLRNRKQTVHVIDYKGVDLYKKSFLYEQGVATTK